MCCTFSTCTPPSFFFVESPKCMFCRCVSKDAFSEFSVRELLWIRQTFKTLKCLQFSLTFSGETHSFDQYSVFNSYCWWFWTPSAHEKWRFWTPPIYGCSFTPKNHSGNPWWGETPSHGCPFMRSHRVPEVISGFMGWKFSGWWKYKVSAFFG